MYVLIITILMPLSTNHITVASKYETIKQCEYYKYAVETQVLISGYTSEVKLNCAREEFI